MKLTTKQQTALKFISDFIAEKKYPPLQTEIAEHMGITQGSAFQHIEALLKKGVITSIKGQVRTIVVTERGWDELDAMKARYNPADGRH